jgi:metal transporter CNNM
MVLVSESPGENHGAIGVVTLEDVIEELIGEEIIDETDVFVDVSRHLKRMNPAAAFAHHHSFRRVSSKNPQEDGKTGRNGSFHAPSVMKPLNKATEPNPTTSTKVTIKPGTELRNAQYATIVTQEERLLGKKAARENYGTMDGNSRRSRGASTLIEERVTVSSDGESGKVVISPVHDESDTESLI